MAGIVNKSPDSEEEMDYPYNMKEIICELLKITAISPGFDMILSKDLSDDIDINYRNWEHDNHNLIMELKLDHILKTWQLHNGHAGTMKIFLHILSKTGRQEYNPLFNLRSGKL